MSNGYKQQAAERAVEFIQSGTVVGLGAGSTAAFAVRRVGELLRTGALQNLECIACSVEVETLARSLDIPLVSLDEQPVIDVTIDGADEATRDGSLIKGGGGALLREKIVAQASRREIIVMDQGKLSPVLGTRWALPVEVLPFGWRSQFAFLESLGARVTVREKVAGQPFHTDQGNLILDCHFGPMPDPNAIAEKLAGRAGIVEHGLFLGIATDLIIAGPEGIEHRTIER